MRRYNSKQVSATKCTWTDKDDLKDVETTKIVYDEKPSCQRRLKFVTSCHEPVYFCNCPVHVGGLYLVDLGKDNYRCVCRIGRSDIIERFPDHYNFESFMTIPVVRPINL